jgi:hypothetical protein
MKIKAAVPALVFEANLLLADRRPVDPTPIIQLKVIDGNGDDLAVEDKGESSRKGRLRRPDPLPSGMTFMQSKLFTLVSKG